MSRLARICLASGLGILGIAPALHLAPIDTALAHTYVVQPNDTLSGIAARYHVSVGYLARVNGMADPDRLQAGSAITVPDGAGYQPGDAAAGYRQYRHAYQARATYSSQTP